MAPVQIAHFVDLAEAQVAASALRASGIPTLIQNENHGQTFFLMQRAIGGFRLWTAEGDADDARAFVEARRTEAYERIPSRRPVHRFVATLLLLLAG